MTSPALGGLAGIRWTLLHMLQRATGGRHIGYMGHGRHLEKYDAVSEFLFLDRYAFT